MHTSEKCLDNVFLVNIPSTPAVSTTFKWTSKIQSKSSAKIISTTGQKKLGKTDPEKSTSKTKNITKTRCMYVLSIYSILQFGFFIQYDRLSKNNSHEPCMYQSIVLIIFIVKIAKTPAMSQTSLLTSKMKLKTSAEIMITTRPQKLNTTDDDIPTAKTGIVINTRRIHAYVFFKLKYS